MSAAYLLLANMVLHLPVVWKTAERKRAHEMTKIGKGKEYDGWVFFICLYSVLTDFMFAYQAMYLIFAGKYSKRKRASIAYMESTVVDISITPPSFKPVLLFLSRSLLSKTPKQVFFNPINIFNSFTHFDDVRFQIRSH